VASQALAALLQQRLDEVRLLVRLRPVRRRFRRSDARTGDAVNRACVVVLTAHLEGFIEDLVIDMIDFLNQSTPATQDLPAVLLAAHVIVEIDEIAQIQDSDKRATRIDQLFRLHAPLWLDQRMTSGRLRAESITSGLGNPGAKEIARVLGVLGLSDVFSTVRLPDGADPEKRINELVGIRNSIAHGGGPSVRDEQLETYVIAVESVALALDQAAAAHLQAMCRIPARPWA
jgi:hypothetical protein